MTYNQKTTIKVALAVYAEDCNQMMCLLKSEESKEYYKKEIGYILDAMAAVDELEEDYEHPKA